MPSSSKRKYLRPNPIQELSTFPRRDSTLTRPIMLTLYGPAGEVAVPLLPKRALTLAQELLTRGVQAIKADQWDTPPL